MAGAAPELKVALQVNPYDKQGMALALQTALNMPLEERRHRHEQMLAAVREHDIHNWYGRFVQDLTGQALRQRSLVPYVPVENRDTVTPLARFPPAHARGAEYRHRK
jgi:hypothetical protein